MMSRKQVAHARTIQELQAENKRLREELHIANRRYGELLMEVDDKHESQTRHDRALWILREKKRVHAAYDAAIDAAQERK